MKRSAQYDTAIPQMELQASGSHACLLRGRKRCLQPVPHRGYDFYQLSGVRGSCSMRSSMGASRPEHPKPYQPQSLNPPAFTHQLGEKILWVWKPKRMLFVQLGSAPRANRQFKWISDSNCAGNPTSGKNHILSPTFHHLQTCCMGLGSQRWEAKKGRASPRRK